MSQWIGTRPRQGARLAVLALGALALATPAAARRPAAEPLPWRVGGRGGFTVDAAAFPDSAGTSLDVYVRIPSGTLGTLLRDSEGQARLRVQTRLRGVFGGAASQEQTQEFAIDPADSTGGFGKVIGQRFAARPGVYRLLVTVVDVLSRSRGPLAWWVPSTARVEGEVRVPAPRDARELSDVEFLWSEREGGRATVFKRLGRTYLPNPERLYGRFAPELRTAFVARSGEEAPWRWRARVLDAAGATIATRESSAAAARVLQGGATVDLAGVKAGAYAVDLEVWQEGEAAPLQRRAGFSVAWQADSWLRSPREVQDDVHFLLGADDEEAFALLSPGEQERYLDEFWAKRDPAPGTPENEARTTFLKRVDHANQTWSRRGLGKGMFSDMGRTYIRYGEPSEVLHQVIPTGDQTVDQVIAGIVASDGRTVGDVNTKGPGGDPRPFELWIYQGPVGLPPDADPAVAGRVRRKQLLFLFVDDVGVGDYRLRYTTE